MSIESRVVAAGRRIAASPLWTGLAVTLFFVLPTVVIPSVPLWVSAVFALLIGPPIVLGCFLLYGLVRRLRRAVGSDETPQEAESVDDETDPLARLKTRYANGEIDEATFERRLEAVIETESVDNDIESTRERIRNR